MPVNALAPEPRNAMLRPYEPTWKEQLAAYLMGDTRPSPERRQFSRGIADILGYLPFTGNILQGQEAAARGDTKGAMMAALPIPGMAKIPAQMEQQAVRQGIRAFHGSPHSFDRFDISKIGSGEGAQVYGHGLYFAGNEDVAQGYREALSPYGKGDRPEDIAARVLHATKGDRNAALEELRNRANSSLASGGSYEGAQRLMQARNIVNTNPEVAGSMYEVNISADPEHFIDYDIPLGQQTPQVKEMLAKAGYEPELLSDKFAAINPVNAEEAQKLRDAGIPGVKYLDQGSRRAGEGSRNYVVFDDKIVEIMRKYGLMGPIGAGIAAKILARQDARQEM